MKWYTDNKNVEHIVTKGSMMGHLQSITWDIYNACIKHHISLQIEWVPRTVNEKADYVSKIVNKDDWSISTDIFDILDRNWGHIPLTGLLLIIILNCQDLLPAFGTQVP